MSMIRRYCIAGTEYELQIPDEKCFTQARNLAPFAVDSVTDPQRFYFDTVQALEPPAGKLAGSDATTCVFSDGGDVIRYIGSVYDDLHSAYIRVTSRGNDHQVQMCGNVFRNGYDVRSVVKAMDVVRHITAGGGVVLHSSLIEWEGKAIVFTAPSGTGKSTQAELWHRFRGAEVINGDRCGLLLRNGAVRAEGVPFSGTSGICKKRSLPVAAIVYLSQSPENTVRRLRGYRAFARIWEGCTVHTWDPEAVSAVTDTVSRIVSAVPVYHLACTPDEMAVQVLQAQLQQEEHA